MLNVNVKLLRFRIRVDLVGPMVISQRGSGSSHRKMTPARGDDTSNIAVGVKDLRLAGPGSVMDGAYSTIDSTENRVFILCAGDGSRWGNYLGVPKQLIAFNGESLIFRMARLLKESGVHDIVCVTQDRRISIPHARSFSPAKCGYLVETILSTVPQWTTRTTILLGDVFFTRRAMRTICSFSGEIAVFGRPWASHLVSCRHGELFGMSFSRMAFQRVVNAAEEVRKLTHAGARGNLWDLYHNLAHLPYNSGQAESRLFRVIDDLTNDFDSPDEHSRRRFIYHAATSRSRIERLKLVMLLSALLPYHLVSRKAVAVDQSVAYASDNKVTVESDHDK